MQNRPDESNKIDGGHDSTARIDDGLINDDIQLSGLDPNLAMKSYFDDPDWLFKTGVGGVLYFASFVIFLLGTQYSVPFILPLCCCLWAPVVGYVLRTLRQKINDPRGKLPEWNDWSDLFVSGMSWLAITTGFVFALGGLGMFSLLVGAAIGLSKTTSMYFVYWAGATAIGIVVLAYVFNLFVAVLMANFAKEETMTSGFAYIKVMKRLFAAPGNFIAAWLIGAGMQILAMGIPVATIIGIILLPMTAFAAQVLSVVLIAQAWSASESKLQKTS